jgi:molybdenum-dependent DNA-binding transcriptional regulator ModE
VAITFTQLRTLLAVVDQGGFTAAAEQLGMTQPAVSRAIHVLEAELGTPLLARGRDGVTLTEAGRRALGHARAALGEHDRLRADVAATAGRVTGTLRLPGTRHRRPSSRAGRTRTQRDSLDLGPGRAVTAAMRGEKLRRRPVKVSPNEFIRNRLRASWHEETGP